MNSSRNKTVNDAASAALDRLVLSEVRAFRRQWLRGRIDGDSTPDRLDRDTGESLLHREEMAPGEKDARTRSWGDRYPGTEDGETQATEHDESPSSDVLGEGPDKAGLGHESGFDSGSAEVLFGEEEERFIQDAVGWLSIRDNKDAVIARIWTLLNETDPESFYSPPSEGLGSQEETGANETADEDQESPEQ